MDELTQNKIFLFVSIVACFGIAWIIQSSLIFNSDASWLMLATKRLLTGGNYTHDFFEINPPMILYVYSPAALLVKITNLPTYIILRAYVFILAAMALLICTNLSHKIFNHSQKMLRTSFLIAICIILLWLPMSEFGQREHLMVIFTLPYFLLITQRLSNTKIENTFKAAAIGIFAGLGFVIKPFFLAPLIFTEIFYRLRKTDYKFIRPEICGIASVFFSFGILLLIFNHDYLSVVVPAVAPLYYQKYGLPVMAMLQNEHAVFAYFALLFYGLRYRYQNPNNLADILMLMTAGFLLVFLLQQTGWYYHALPLLMGASMLLQVLYAALVAQKNISTQEYISLLFFTLLLTAYLALHESYLSTSILYFPVTFFALFTGLFSFLLAAALLSKNPLQITISITCILIAAIAFYKYLLHSPLIVHIFLLTSILLVLLFALFIPNKTATGKLKYIQFALLGMVLFAVPFYQSGYVYNYGQAYKKLYGNLLVMMNQYPHKSVYFFSDVADFGFPALDYTQQTLAARFPAFSWIPSLLFSDDQQTYVLAYSDHAQSMNFYINAIVEDFNKLKPDVVFIDARNTSADHKKTYFGGQQIDYVRFFSLNHGFGKAWQHYHYVKTVDGQPLFKFNIYERNPSV